MKPARKPRAAPKYISPSAVADAGGEIYGQGPDMTIEMITDMERRQKVNAALTIHPRQDSKSCAHTTPDSSKPLTVDS